MGSGASTIPDNVEEDVRQFSHFPPRDIQEWSSSFRSEYPGGCMTLKDLEAMFRSFFPFGSPTNFSRRLFETINISQTETVDFHELLIAYSILVKGSDHEKLRWMFRFYDKDNDGVVSKEEMVEVVQCLADMTSHTLDISIDAEGIVSEIFASVESDRGFLTFEDFKTLSIRSEKLFKMLVPFSD
ncbi:CALCIUM-BINDING PROTEIN OF THE RECOVERIN SUBFAMILY [Encephalitozoon cuniculi GB-M1]|uniref:CALCIUM-BINDING PROTEIN OF THE RECOVERIN SUBFAMILY n=2 Tax=Encephalitozoon cuniculi TaxID=6035 RepID=Q8SS44_ENCCU|nr:Ca2+-binding protein [Encephalitozoon cuniculi GB-M1]AGE95313.1 calcium-binding protein of the recoverin subfamily [Encephalitozoon cuniculi]KMV66284.1 Ca2+-binding protein [Encephalitozoon cuniculi EcunIII-L]UYI27460.1 neuronal calcium sensor 1 [Encephalitozoon cuniculi]CAD25268.1 CALCIUM-BINDING PROTEIN OF THE RECOVERIN SUBFAMILY [Encephalitozoon cuniculi GB-M1]